MQQLAPGRFTIIKVCASSLAVDLRHNNPAVEFSIYNSDSNHDLISIMSRIKSLTPRIDIHVTHIMLDSTN